MREVLTVQRAMSRSGVSRRTIYNWMAAGKVDYVRNATGHVRIFADSLWRDKDGKRLPQGTEPIDGQRHPDHHA